jgi:hypothetical protein
MSTGARAFPDTLKPVAIAKTVVIDERRPAIPEWLAPGVSALITDCWADNPDDRPSFDEIVERLQDMDFKVAGGVNSVKVACFVADLRALEAAGAE